MEENTVSVLEAAKLLGVGKDTVHPADQGETHHSAPEDARAAIAVHDRPHQSSKPTIESAAYRLFKRETATLAGRRFAIFRSSEPARPGKYF